MNTTATRTSRLGWGAVGAICAALVVLAHSQLSREAERTQQGRAERAVITTGAILGTMADRDPDGLPEPAARAIGATAAGIVAADGRIEAVRLWTADGELVAGTDGAGVVAPATDADRVVTEDVAGGKTRTIVPLARSDAAATGVVEVVEIAAPAAHPWGALRAAAAGLLVIAVVGFSATFVRRPLAAADEAADVATAGVAVPPTREPRRRSSDAGRADDAANVPAGSAATDPADEVASLRAAVDRARGAERAAQEQLRSAEIELGMLREERQTGPAVRIRELQEALRASQTEAAHLAERLRWLSIEEDDDPKIAALRDAMRRSEAEEAVRRAGQPPDEHEGRARELEQRLVEAERTIAQLIAEQNGDRLDASAEPPLAGSF